MAQGSFPILFITATRIGDAVLSSGLIRRLAEEIPNARFTIVAGAPAAPLFKDMPNLDEVIVFEKTKNHGHWFSLWRRVRKRRWGLVVDLRGSAISTFLSRRKRAVYRRQPGPPVHKVIEAARVLGLEADPPPPFLYTSAKTEALADRLTAGEGPILALAPSANWVGKTWPAERFTLLAMTMLGQRGPMQGARLMVLGAPQDAPAVTSLRHVLPKHRFIDLVGKVDLLTAYACLERARLFIGNDSGLMHLAAAAGVPTLGLFGPSDERHYAPWGEAAAVIRGPRNFDQIQMVDPEHQQALCHMMDLTVDAVAAAAFQLHADTEPAHA